MIYALRKTPVDIETRKAIAAAIVNGDSSRLADFAKGLIIRHILDAPTSGTYNCIYCLGVLQHNGWYFAHNVHGGRDDCVGSSRYLGIMNPASQGCYVAKGTEVDYPRTSCNCLAYCHKAPEYECNRA